MWGQGQPPELNGEDAPWKRSPRTQHDPTRASYFPKAPVLTATPTTLEAPRAAAEIPGSEWRLAGSPPFVEDVTAGGGRWEWTRKRSHRERNSLTTKFLYPVSTRCLPSLFSHDLGKANTNQGRDSASPSIDTGAPEWYRTNKRANVTELFYIAALLITQWTETLSKIHWDAAEGSPV